MKHAVYWSTHTLLPMSLRPLFPRKTPEGTLDQHIQKKKKKAVDAV